MLNIDFTIAINTGDGGLEEIQIVAPIIGISRPLGERIYTLSPIVFYRKAKQRFVARYIHCEADVVVLSYFLESTSGKTERVAEVNKFEITDGHPIMLISELIYPKKRTN